MRRFIFIIREEFRLIFKDEGALLILLGALFIYSALYGFVYKPEVVHDVPVAVVDMDNTPASRSLCRMLNSTSVAEVAYNPPSLERAKELFMERKVSGILVIPDGFEKRAESMQQNHVSLYADGSYFLLYSSFMESVANVILAAGADLQQQNLQTLGLSSHQAEVVSEPIDFRVEMLFNPYSGYATALLPAVLIVILQQVLLIGIGMVMGTCNEFKRWDKYKGSSALEIVLGKSIAYIAIYIPALIYLFGVDYKFFGYPTNEQSIWDVVWFLLPYFLSAMFLAFTFGGLLRRRESGILYLISLSIFFIMISGISWSEEGMPSWLYALGQTLPSSNAIDGFVRIRTMGAGLSDVMTQWIILWILTGIFGVTAVMSVARAKVVNRADSDSDTDDSSIIKS